MSWQGWKNFFLIFYQPVVFAQSVKEESWKTPACIYCVLLAWYIGLFMLLSVLYAIYEGVVGSSVEYVYFWTAEFWQFIFGGGVGAFFSFTGLSLLVILGCLAVYVFSAAAGLARSDKGWNFGPVTKILLYSLIPLVIVWILTSIFIPFSLYEQNSVALIAQVLLGVGFTLSSLYGCVLLVLQGKAQFDLSYLTSIKAFIVYPAVAALCCFVVVIFYMLENMHIF